MSKKLIKKLAAFGVIAGGLIGKISHAEKPSVVSWADISQTLEANFSDREKEYSSNLGIPANLDMKFHLNSPGARGVGCDCILLNKSNSYSYYAFHRQVFNESENGDMPSRTYKDNVNDINKHINTKNVQISNNIALPAEYHLADSRAKNDGISLFYSPSKTDKITEYPLCLPNKNESDLLIIETKKDGSQFVKQWPKWLVDYFSERDKNNSQRLLAWLVGSMLGLSALGYVVNKSVEISNQNINDTKETSFEECY